MCRDEGRADGGDGDGDGADGYHNDRRSIVWVAGLSILLVVLVMGSILVLRPSKKAVSDMLSAEREFGEMNGVDDFITDSHQTHSHARLDDNYYDDDDDNAVGA